MIITKNLSGSYMIVTLLFLANDIIVVEETTMVLESSRPSQEDRDAFPWRQSLHHLTCSQSEGFQAFHNIQHLISE